MKLRNCLSTVVLAMTALGGSANAALLVQDQLVSFSEGTFVIGDSTNSAFDFVELTYSLFDPALGTLTSARWTLDSTLTGEGVAMVVSLSINPNDIFSGQLKLTVTADTTFFGTVPLLGTGGQFFQTAKTTSGTCTTTAANPLCMISVSVDEVFNGVIAAPNLAELTGVGTFSQFVEGFVQLENSLTPSQGLAFIGSAGFFTWANSPAGTGNGKLSLIYDYVPVPEPSTLAFAAVAFAVLAVLRFGRSQHISN